MVINDLQKASNKRDVQSCSLPQQPNRQGPHRSVAIPGVFPGSAERLLGIGCWDVQKPLTPWQRRFLGMPKELNFRNVCGSSDWIFFAHQKKCVSFGFFGFFACVENWSDFTSYIQGQ
jgi:hypothetical protein